MATQVTTTRQVFDHHIGALVAGDLDDLMKDYSEDSVVIGPEGVVKGRDGIRGLYEGFFSTLFKPGTYKLGADIVQGDGEALLVIWHASCVGADIPFAADTFIIRNGKIKIQTFAPKLEPHS